MKLVVVPLTPGCLGRVGSLRNDPATAIGAPRADTNRGFRVSRSIFDATRHVGAFVVPVAPRERPWFSFGGLQGRLVGSTAVRFFDANGSGRLIPSAGAARHHPIYPGPEEHRETNRWHPQRKRSRHAGPRADARAGEDCSETAGRGHPSGNPARRNASASAAIFFGST